MKEYSLSSRNRVGVPAEHVIPGLVPVINKLFQLRTFSVEPVIMLPYSSDDLLFGFLVHD